MRRIKQLLTILFCFAIFISSSTFSFAGVPLRVEREHDNKVFSSQYMYSNRYRVKKDLLLDEYYGPTYSFSVNVSGRLDRGNKNQYANVYVKNTGKATVNITVNRDKGGTGTTETLDSMELRPGEEDFVKIDASQLKSTNSSHPEDDNFHLLIKGYNRDNKVNVRLRVANYY